MNKPDYRIRGLIAVNKFEQYCINQKPYLIWRQLAGHDCGIDGEIEFTHLNDNGQIIALGEVKKIVIKSLSAIEEGKPVLILTDRDIQYYHKSEIDIIIVIYHHESDQLFSVNPKDIEIVKNDFKVQRVNPELIGKVDIKKSTKVHHVNSADKKYSENEIKQKNETILEAKLDFCDPGKKSWREYEDICLSIIDYLFRESFRNYDRIIQSRNENGLDIKDLIIPNRSNYPFWNEVRTDYSARNIVFEFKNYDKKIGKDQLVQTSNYLKKKTYGRFAIIFSRKGLSESGLTEQLELLRDDDKIIISLNDEDLIQLIREKSKGNNAENLLEKLKTEIELKM